MRKKLLYLAYISLVLGLIIFSIRNIKRMVLGADIIGAMRMNTLGIYDYYSTQGEYPILKDSNNDFWSIKKNQYLKFRFQFATDSKQIESFLNPVTKKFDWLAVSEDNKIYSSDMPESLLIASPPIRVKEVRCPLKITDPPFYTDLTKFSIYDENLHQHFQKIWDNSSDFKMKKIYEENMKIWNKERSSGSKP